METAKLNPQQSESESETPDNCEKCKCETSELFPSHYAGKFICRQCLAREELLREDEHDAEVRRFRKHGRREE